MDANPSSRLVLVLAGASAAGLPHVRAAAADEQITTLGLQKIVVTAQKREQDVQAVPISISTLSASAIERRGVQGAASRIYVIYGVAGAAGSSIAGHLIGQTQGYGEAFLLAAASMLASVTPTLALRGAEHA